MIDEAEQIVYHAMHYGWPSKEHQAVCRPPSITSERKRERVGQGVSGRANSPPPACHPYSLCLLQTGRASLRRSRAQLILLSHVWSGLVQPLFPT